MDVTYKYAGPAGSVALYGDPFVVKDAWQDWVKDVWVKQLVATGYEVQRPPFVPTYESGTVTWPGNDGKLQSAPLNELHFPTRETCDVLAGKYGAIVVEVPFFGLGPVASAAVQRLLLFPGGTLPAYQLANYYTNNPEDKSSAADSLCKLLIQRVTA